MGLLQDKLSKFRTPQMYMERGVYPYFREIDSAQDTEGNDGWKEGFDVRL